MANDPDYAGEPVPIRVVNPRGANNDPLDGSNATAAVWIVDAAGVSVGIDGVNMPWDGAAFQYSWESPAGQPGAYRARVEVLPTGADRPSINYIDIVLEPPPTEPLIPYGATVDDVKALLPNRRWTAGTKPDIGDVSRFLQSAGSVLNVSTTPPPADPAKAARLTRLARRAVVLGAAAQAEAAGAPERANPNDASSYASWLQARYLEAVEAVEGYYLELVDEVGGIVEAGDVDADPAWFFPDPVGWAARGI